MIMDLTFHISYFREREIDRQTDGKKQKERWKKENTRGKERKTQKGTLRPSYRHEE
jgi:hypothetical protein